MTLDLAWEPLAAMLDDGLADLVRAHWDEVGVFKEQMPLDVDWDGYRRQEMLGNLRLLGARIDEKLIGYNSFFVLPGHLHYKSTPHAMGDAIYVKPENRKSGAGPLMIIEAEAAIAKLYAPRFVRFVYHDKAFLDYLKPILEKMGYEHQENNFSKMVRA